MAVLEDKFKEDHLKLGLMWGTKEELLKTLHSPKDPDYPELMTEFHNGTITLEGARRLSWIFWNYIRTSKEHDVLFFTDTVPLVDRKVIELEQEQKRPQEEKKKGVLSRLLRA